MASDLASKPEENFDIYDEAGQWLGTAARSEVHAKGLWHRSIHCWVARRTQDGRLLVLFQQRHADKDTFPLYFDITAAGHLAAGETYEEASRELEEELGIRCDFAALLPLGEARKEMPGTAQGVPFIDREISQVYGHRYEGELHALRLQADEVAGVYEADLHDMIGLFEDRLAQVTANGVRLDPVTGALLEAAVTVTAEQFVTRPADYYAGVFRQLLGHLA